MSKRVIIFGTGKFAEVAYEYFQHDSDYEVAGFTVDSEYLTSDTFFDLPVVPFENVEKHFPPEDFNIYIALVYNRMNRIRAEKFYEAKQKGYRIASYISSHAFIWRNVELGEGVFIFENNVIQPFVKIGDNTILWSGNHIGHHSKIGNHCFIASHVVVSGMVEIGDYSFLGVNSTIVNGVKVGEKNFIGANVLITRSTKPNSSYVSKATKAIDIPPEKFLR